MRYLSIVGLAFLILACGEDDMPNGPENQVDLEVPFIRVNNETPLVGKEFTLSVTVRNQGTALSDSTTLRYYQSSDDNFSNDDARIDSVIVKPIPESSETDPKSIDLTAPLSHGTYYYFACVDTVNSESDTTNNCSRAVKVEAVDILSVEDASDTEGGTLTFTVNLTSELLQPATFYYSTYYGRTATAEQGDYEGREEESMTVDSGNTFNISISTIQDSDSDDETFYLYVTGEKPHPDNTPDASKNRGTGTIYDDGIIISTADKKDRIVEILFGLNRGEADTKTKHDYNDYGNCPEGIFTLNDGSRHEFNCHKTTGDPGFRGGHAGWDVRTLYEQDEKLRNATFYSLTAGVVVNVSALNTVAIYDSNNEKTTIYIHASEIDQSIRQKANSTPQGSVRVGDILGKQGEKGFATAPHVHIEVREGMTKLGSFGAGATDSAAMAHPSIAPIDYLYSVLKEMGLAQ